MNGVISIFSFTFRNINIVLLHSDDNEKKIMSEHYQFSCFIYYLKYTEIIIDFYFGAKIMEPKLKRKFIENMNVNWLTSIH